MNIKTIMSVAIGGFLGGITRYELSVLLGDDGILYANLIGSFLLAFITYYFSNLPRIYWPSFKTAHISVFVIQMPY